MVGTPGWSITCVMGLLALAPTVLPGRVAAQDDLRIVEVELVPARRAQIAVWIERDGAYLQTLALTAAVAHRGIGNRPGASQMNSGFRWPYGRREGVLPVWAHRRASPPGAGQFRRVIFQDRTSEGWASRSSNDYSRDDYFCLSFRAEASGRDALDAVTCPSVFNSDKGRYLTAADVTGNYVEPAEQAPGAGMMRPLDLASMYPPRRDVERCALPSCFDHPDVSLFAADARAVMPEIDAVTMATPPEGAPTVVSFTVPDGWPIGDYDVFVEVNTEGDYNAVHGPAQYPTPRMPTSAWDYWAINYGYPYRGQPSVVYRVPISIGLGGVIRTVAQPAGYGSVEGRDGGLHAMDGSITDDPAGAPGSGADRLHQTGNWRVRVTVVGPEVCQMNAPPDAIRRLSVTPYPERRAAHRYAHLSFVAPGDDLGIARYDVRVGQEPIVDDASFMRALPAQAATLDSEALVVPRDGRAGDPVEVDFGGLAPENHYFVAVRAVDRCNAHGEMQVAEYVTPAIEFTTVSPCFVATAAYGTPMASEIGALRRLRDRHLRTNAAGRALVAAYEVVGPVLADAIRGEPSRRAAARAALAPIVALARALD